MAYEADITGDNKRYSWAKKLRSVIALFFLLLLLLVVFPPLLYQPRELTAPAIYGRRMESIPSSDINQFSVPKRSAPDSSPAAPSFYVEAHVVDNDTNPTRN